MTHDITTCKVACPKEKGLPHCSQNSQDWLCSLPFLLPSTPKPQGEDICPEVRPVSL